VGASLALSDGGRLAVLRRAASGEWFGVDGSGRSRSGGVWSGVGGAESLDVDPHNSGFGLGLIDPAQNARRPKRTSKAMPMMMAFGDLTALACAGDPGVMDTRTHEPREAGSPGRDRFGPSGSGWSPG